jgi:hypothetical protein
MGHDADTLPGFRWRSGLCGQAWRRSDRFGLCRCADWRRLNRNLRGRPGFLGRYSPERRLLRWFFVIALVFLTAMAFLRVTAFPTGVFLRFALPLRLVLVLVATRNSLDAQGYIETRGRIVAE